MAENRRATLKLGGGRHQPLASLRSSNSSAAGRWSQTETEMIAPSQVVSKAKMLSTLEDQIARVLILWHCFQRNNPGFFFGVS